MSCNGCRVLRKGCNENCILRQSLLGIDTPQGQANATLFVAKFFGRAGLMSLLSSVHQPQRPALFQSLLFEACGRTVNKVSGAVGLSWTGNWHVCQSAVETVLRGGDISQLSEANDVDLFRSQNLNSTAYEGCKREEIEEPNDLNLSLTSGSPANVMGDGTVKRGPASPSEESETTTFESDLGYNRSLQGQGETKPLRLFI